MVAIPAESRLWVLTDGKIGDETQCFGIADALGLAAERRLVAPRRLFALLAPRGPVDPREAIGRAGGPLAPPFPDIAIAAGRRTVPYLRALKRASPTTFTVFVKDPYTGTGAADLIWVPGHDALRGPNVITSLTPAHRVSRAVLTAARAAPDPRIASLPSPRTALILGGDSQHHHFTSVDAVSLVAIARQVLRQGGGLMVSPSRRTPERLIRAIAATVDAGAFFWDGQGENPYAQMLAHADAIVVTGDSVNMAGEAVATGAPVHVYEPSGGHRKITAYLDRLVDAGSVRRWKGAFETWRCAPLDATPGIAAEVARRYIAYRERDAL